QRPEAGGGFPELAGDNMQVRDQQSFTMDVTNVHSMLTWLNTADGKDTIPDVPDVPGIPDSTAFFNQLSNFSEYGVESDCPEDRVAAAMLGDADPSWGAVVTSPLPDPKREQGGVAAVLLTWLPEGPTEPFQESPAETSKERPIESPVESSEEIPKETPLESPLESSPEGPPEGLPRGSPEESPEGFPEGSSAASILPYRLSSSFCTTRYLCAALQTNHPGWKAFKVFERMARQDDEKRRRELEAKLRKKEEEEEAAAAAGRVKLSPAAQEVEVETTAEHVPAPDAGGAAGTQESAIAQDAAPSPVLAEPPGAAAPAEPQPAELPTRQEQFQTNPDSYNGAVRENYAWSQDYSDLEIKVPVPKHIVKGKQINLNKGDEYWWNAILEGEEQIDIDKINKERSMATVDEEEHAVLDRLTFDYHQKLQGKPQSHELVGASRPTPPAQPCPATRPLALPWVPSL
ncbi:PREDICTED: nudC domain-containing protein 3, partial [Pygoscelis adeliae]|uniref:nudC domain-containing protein 3 n=1 Tax=Pygoscelis adeliae TaxID=9238 RepID=UPI0004F4FD40